MASVNKAIIIGNLGKDPETRYLPSGDAMTNITVATTEKWKDKKSGEQKEETEWHRVTFFGRLAEVADEYLQKGSQVYVEGRFKTSKYEKDGETRYSTSIIASSMKMLGSKAGGQERREPAPSKPAQGKPAPGKAQASGSFDDMDDDIPF